MAKENRGRGKATMGGMVLGIVATLAVLLGLGELDLGFLPGGLGAEESTPVETTIEQPADTVTYCAVITIEDDVIKVNDAVVAADALETQLADCGNQTVLVQDINAKHGTWMQVMDVLKSLDCVIQTE